MKWRKRNSNILLCQIEFSLEDGENAYHLLVHSNVGQIALFNPIFKNDVQELINNYSQEMIKIIERDLKGK